MIIRRTFLKVFAVLTLALGAAPALAETRILSTSFGDVEIPAAPQRIVTTHYIATQPLLDLGLLPVGQGEINAANVPAAYWEKIKDTPIVAPAGKPNFEQIAALQPDLIFEISIADEAQVARLRQIAPVVLIGIGGPDRAQWQKRVGQIADAVGRLDAYEAVNKAFTDRQAAIAADYKDVEAKNAIGIWAAWDFGEPNVFASNTMVGRILTPAGARFAPGVEALSTEDGEETPISNELIGQTFADSDVIFYATNLDLSEIEPVTETRALPTYKALRAVAAGNDVPLGKLTIAGFGDAHAVLDNYETALKRLAGR